MFDLVAEIINSPLRINGNTRNVLQAIADMANHDENEPYAWPCIGTIAEKAKCSKSTAWRSITALERMGVIRVERQYFKGGQINSKYFIIRKVILSGEIIMQEPKKKPAPAPTREFTPPEPDIDESAFDREPGYDELAYDNESIVVEDSAPALDYIPAEQLFEQSIRRDQETAKAEAAEIAHNALAGVQKFFIEPEPEPVNRGERGLIVTGSTLPTPAGVKTGWAERIWTAVTGQTITPSKDRDQIYELLAAYYPNYRDEAKMAEALKPYFEAWIIRKSKRGTTYSATNPGWLFDWFVAGAIPEAAPVQVEPATPPAKKLKVW